MTDAELFDFDNELSVAVLGRGNKFFLVKLGDNDYAGEAKSVAEAYGYSYCGLIEIKDGEPTVLMEPDADSMQVMVHAGLHFPGLLAESLQRKQQAAAFCERLFALPDPRS